MKAPLDRDKLVASLRSAAAIMEGVTIGRDRGLVRECEGAARAWRLAAAAIEDGEYDERARGPA